VIASVGGRLPLPLAEEMGAAAANHLRHTFPDVEVVMYAGVHKKLFLATI